MTWIPTDEDFTRARRLHKDHFRNLGEVARCAKLRFMPVCPLLNVYILPQRDVDFRAYVLFEKDRDLKECEQSGVTREIATFIREELDRVARSKQEETSVAVEFFTGENRQELKQRLF